MVYGRIETRHTNWLYCICTCLVQSLISWEPSFNSAAMRPRVSCNNSFSLFFKGIFICVTNFYEFEMPKFYIFFFTSKHREQKRKRNPPGTVYHRLSCGSQSRCLLHPKMHLCATFHDFLQPITIFMLDLQTIMFYPLFASNKNSPYDAKQKPLLTASRHTTLVVNAKIKTVAEENNIIQNLGLHLFHLLNVCILFD